MYSIRTTADYTANHGSSSEYCNICRYFKRPTKWCSFLYRFVSANGWCRFFRMK